MEVSFVEIAALCSISLLFVHLLLRNSAKQTTLHGVRSYPFIGVLPSLVQNQHRILEWMTEILLRTPGRTVSLKMLGQLGSVITADPANVEYMAKSNFDNYPRGERNKEMLMDFLGHGIFSTDGEEWKWQRKVASVEFNKKSLRNHIMDVVQLEIADRLLPLLTRIAEKDMIVDLQEVIGRFGFDNICKVAFNEDPACLSQEILNGKETPFLKFMHAFEDAEYLTMENRLMNPFKFTWKIKKLLNIGSERRLKEATSLIHDYAGKIVTARKEKNLEGYNDLLSRFASNSDSSDQFLKDIILSLLVAGKETTSSGLTWFFWILSTRPHVEKKIVEEVRAVRSSSKNTGETFSYDELRDMHYLHAAITESMRLYPPVPLDTQTCFSDDTFVDGTFVGKEWSAGYCSYAMARNEDIWGKDCADYKPERWLEDGVFKPQSPFRYPVFHAGPRVCLGKEMAYIQLKSVVACVVERFEMDVLNKEKTPDYQLSFTLRMKHGLPIKIREKALIMND